jgi:hypothetical protein
LAADGFATAPQLRPLAVFNGTLAPCARPVSLFRERLCAGAMVSIRLLVADEVVLTFV